MLHRTVGINGVYADDFVEMSPVIQDSYIKEWKASGITCLNTVVVSHRFFKPNAWEFIFELGEEHVESD